MRLFLSPHNDDAVLFGTFTLLRHKPFVITVLQPVDRFREMEDVEAFDVLGVTHEQWPYSEDEPDWDVIRKRLREYDEEHMPAKVYAPRPVHRGNQHHNIIGDIAVTVFGRRVIPYLTYRHVGLPEPEKQRGTEVDYEPVWLNMKLRALACYGSQMIPELGAHRHFVEDLREYTA